MITVLIFALGAVCSYFMGKQCFKTSLDGSWTVNLMLFTIIISALMSWIGFASFLFIWLIILLFNWGGGNKPANW